MTTYYTGGNFRGQGFREVSAEEADTLRTLALAAPADPPWTPERAALRDRRDAFVVALFEDGCSMPSIAAVGADRLKINNVARIIRERRDEFGRGTRRLIPREAPNAKTTVPFRRELTTDERRTLKNLDRMVPRNASGKLRDRQSVEWANLVEYMQRLRDDRIALATIGEAIGVTREYVRQNTTVPASEAVSA